MKIKVGKTYNSIPSISTEDVDVYECDKCKARDYDPNECFWCKKRAVMEHHGEEGRVGLL